MSNEEKKQWYAVIYGCYFERVDEYGNKEVIDPTTIRTVTVDNQHKSPIKPLRNSDGTTVIEVWK